MFTSRFSKPGAVPDELSVVAAEMKISGDVNSPGALSVSGHIKGNVRCARFTQSESGTVTGDIVADEARVAGLVEGRIDAQAVTVDATARITGDVTYETITIAAGARLDGRLARRASLAPVDGEDQGMLIATPTEANREEEEADSDEVMPEGLLPLIPRKRVGRGGR